MLYMDISSTDIHVKHFEPGRENVALVLFRGRILYYITVRPFHVMM